MSTKFFFRIWVVICGLAFAYGYVRATSIGDVDIDLYRLNVITFNNWFDKIVYSINQLTSLGQDSSLGFRITWGISTLILIGLSTLLLGLAVKWVRDSIDSKG